LKTVQLLQVGLNATKSAVMLRKKKNSSFSSGFLIEKSELRPGKRVCALGGKAKKRERDHS